MSQELWGNNIGQGEKRSKEKKKKYIYIYMYSDGFTDQGNLEHVMVDGRGRIFYLFSH